MSSTKYLDDLILDTKGHVVKDVMDAFKGYSGLFAFILSISQMEGLSNEAKVGLIKRIVNASMEFMTRKYQANLEIYKKQAGDSPTPGKRFNDEVLIPLQLQEDYELGIQEAKELLYVEMKDILLILNIDLDIE